LTIEPGKYETSYKGESPLVRLDLRAPLEYEKAPELAPFCCPPDYAHVPELLFCFELDQKQAGRIDPQEDHFLGKLVFAGKGKNGPDTVRLPAGLYLFDQRRGVLKREECIVMAIEQHKDGLWERLHLENLLYIRHLFEDGSPVTQIFRPYREN
jgi:hypothetical protein